MSDSLERLFTAVVAARSLDPATSRTARLLRSSRGKVSKKLAEEAIEVVIDAMNGERADVVKESADLIYHLVVLWVSCGIRPRDVWAEMERREKLLGMAEKLPKLQAKAPRQGDGNHSVTAAARSVIALSARRAAKRR
jgi:phosphoribosyl-ATP pyrophosphohydrolase